MDSHIGESVFQYQCTTFCEQVTDVKEDLRDLPSNLRNLCIKMDPYYVGILAPGSFSHLSSLEYLKLDGCFSKISPKAFTGLLKLTSLCFVAFMQEGCCEVSVDFSGLPSLQKLFLTQYSVLSMTPNVFDSIPQLEILNIEDTCLKDISEVLCRLGNVKLLKWLHIYGENVYQLRLLNCSFFNTSDSHVPTVYN
ncbi:MAG: hypothetical protein ACRC7H_02165, partial [Plesiomonas shigelloides]